MYMPGNQINFESRLHQLATTQLDFDNFIIEGDSYNSQGALLIKWNREFQKRAEIMLKSEKYFLIPALPIGIQSNALYDVQGNIVYDVNGDIIQTF